MKWLSKLSRLKKSKSSARTESQDVSPESGAKPVGLSADNPITNAEADALGRAKSAQSFAEQILALDCREGVVVGVLGPWGSGKTSFVNLARTQLKDLGVADLEFNPWMFSGADQLVQAFFVELSAQLKIRPAFAEISKLVEDYGETFSGLGWLPLVGPWIERGRAATKILTRLLQRRKEGVGSRRDKVREALSKLSKPIIVVVDDIDRLTTSEIRDIFKLVRLTANFPNIIYVLAFDRVRVEQALGEQGISGRDYLEKILQIGIDLPSVSLEVLNTQIFRALDDALARTDQSWHFDANLWPDIFVEIIRPLIRNMRDVRRYAAAVYGTVRESGGQVALVDVLALEAVRVFLPDVFRRFQSAASALTTASDAYGERSNSGDLKQQVDSLIAAAGDHVKVVSDLVRRLFPAAEHHLGGSHYGPDWKNQWLRDRRVAHEDVFRFYLERTMNAGLQAFTEAENAWIRFADQEALDDYLRSLPIDRLQDVISSLEVYEDNFRPEHVVPATVVLLNLLPSLPERQGGMFELDTRMVVGRVVYRLIRSPKDPSAIEAAVRQILPHVHSLYSQFELISDVGYRENVGHKLVSEAAAAVFEKKWRDAVRAADSAILAEEKELLRTLALARKDSGPDEPPLAVSDSPAVTYALLKSARRDSRSQTMGTRAVRRHPRLAWDTLIELYGDETTLRERVEALKTAPPPESGELLGLVDKYLGGWRPKEFDDSEESDQ